MSAAQPNDRLECGHRHIDGVTHAHCTTVPADVVGVTHCHAATEQPNPIVLVTIFDNASTGETMSVHLSADDARRIAAGLLNSADAIDGTTPLVFVPRQT